MIPGPYVVFVDSPGAPRIRGDDPFKTVIDLLAEQCSPHPRG